MNNDEANTPPALPPIPEDFHSVEHDGPFTTCSRCSTPLADVEYFQINKAIRHGECVFEYAFCSSCRDSLIEEFSEESKNNLLRYQEQHLRPDASGIVRCGFCGREKDGLTDGDFTITALGHLDGLLDSLLICFECQTAMHELLSQQTKDVRRRFFEDVPGVPPDWEIWEPEDQEIHQVTAPMNQSTLKPQPSVPVGALAILGTPE